MAKLRFGILGAAKIACEKVIPAIISSSHCELSAVASRSPEKAAALAKDFAFSKVFGSYEELLADPEIDAIYNPLPNHMHVEWSIKAAQTGKHVLCEKPIALSAHEARSLLSAREQYKVYIQEAFMVLTNPQWQKVRSLIDEGVIGEVRSIQAHFSFYNDKPENIRNVAAFGGGAMLDIGCYPLAISRFLLGQNPSRVLAMMNFDPAFGTDRLNSAIFEFKRENGPPVVLNFITSTQSAGCQRYSVFGTKGNLSVEVPYNPPKDRQLRILLDDSSTAPVPAPKTILLDPCDQYELMCDAFAQAVLHRKPQPVSLEWSIGNMEAIDAAFLAARSGKAEPIPSG